MHTSASFLRFPFAAIFSALFVACTCGFAPAADPMPVDDPSDGTFPIRSNLKAGASKVDITPAKVEKLWYGESA